MRKIRKLWAFLIRTFVTDCPRCHKHFFGYHKFRSQVKIGNVHYRYVCHRCANPQLEKKS